MIILLATLLVGWLIFRRLRKDKIVVKDRRGNTITFEAGKKVSIQYTDGVYLDRFRFNRPYKFFINGDPGSVYEVCIYLVPLQKTVLVTANGPWFPRALTVHLKEGQLKKLKAFFEL